MEKYNKILVEAKIRPSIQRLAIYEFLCKNKIHPDVETIYSKLEKLYPTLSRTTVYNTLELFAQNEIVQTIKIDDDKIRYDADTSNHSHFKCTKCNMIFDLHTTEDSNKYLDSCKDNLPNGFIVNKFQTNIWGYCSECASKNVESKYAND